MSEYIVELNNNAVSGGKFLLGAVYLDAQEVVRCRDCKHCTQRDAIFPPIVCERWGYYNFKTEPDRFCAWGEKKVDE